MALVKDLSKTYQKKSDKQHILDNPDTYIGSVENLDSMVHVYDDKSEDVEKGGNTIKQKEINLVPGLYKLFDEGIVNCRDHCIRMEQAIKDKKPDSIAVTYIDVGINADEGIITLINDGNGIDIAQHPEYKVWIPELIFGHLRTSTNYDKDEKKIVGGKNGFGFKLVLIWSSWGRIETVDHTRGLKYVQEFSDNLDNIGKPTITKCKSKPYTKVSFKPDYARLKLQGLTPDMIAMSNIIQKQLQQRISSNMWICILVQNPKQSEFMKRQMNVGNMRFVWLQMMNLPRYHL